MSAFSMAFTAGKSNFKLKYVGELDLKNSNLRECLNIAI
jgi:hypothetical protein